MTSGIDYDSSLVIISYYEASFLRSFYILTSCHVCANYYLVHSQEKSKKAVVYHLFNAEYYSSIKYRKVLVSTQRKNGS